MISASILAHSRHPNGSELITFELTYPRFIHSEFMTHRTFSRNAASSRAIPVMKMLKAVIKNPARPVHWGANQAGMQAHQELEGWRRKLAEVLWVGTRYPVAAIVWLLTKIGLHKQVANRLLEPWSHITVIASVNDRWLKHMLKLRFHADAQPEFRKLATWMLGAYQRSKAVQLEYGEWHRPMHTPELAVLSHKEERDACVGRLARVSYLTHDGRRDPSEDVALAVRLRKAAEDGNPGHFSPFEHLAQAVLIDAPYKTPVSNFGPGWAQYRHMQYMGDYDPIAEDKMTTVV